MLKRAKRLSCDSYKVIVSVFIEELHIPKHVLNSKQFENNTLLSVCFEKSGKLSVTKDIQVDRDDLLRKTYTETIILPVYQTLELAATIYRDKKDNTYQQKVGHIILRKLRRNTLTGLESYQTIGRYDLKLHEILADFEYNPIQQFDMIVPLDLLDGARVKFLVKTVIPRDTQGNEIRSPTLDDGMSIISDLTDLSSLAGSVVSPKGRVGVNNSSFVSPPLNQENLSALTISANFNDIPVITHHYSIASISQLSDSSVGSGRKPPSAPRRPGSGKSRVNQIARDESSEGGEFESDFDSVSDLFSPNNQTMHRRNRRKQVRQDFGDESDDEPLNSPEVTYSKAQRGFRNKTDDFSSREGADNEEYLSPTGRSKISTTPPSASLVTGLSALHTGSLNPSSSRSSSRAGTSDRLYLSGSDEENDRNSPNLSFTLDTNSSSNNTISNDAVHVTRGNHIGLGDDSTINSPSHTDSNPSMGNDSSTEKSTRKKAKDVGNRNKPNNKQGPLQQHLTIPGPTEGQSMF
jgi:hypothetical protein